MKTTTLTLILMLLSGSLMADELKLKPREKSFNEFMNSNKGAYAATTGHEGEIGDRKFQDLWKYWFVESGETPESFKLSPMKWDSVSENAKKWNGIFAASINEKGYDDLFCTQDGFYIKAGSKYAGCGFSISNPFPSGIKILIEGHLRIYDGSQVFVYLKDNNKITVLADSSEPKIHFTREVKYPDSTKKLRYIKLLVESEMNSEAELFIIGTYNRFPVDKTYPIFASNDNLERQFQPTFFFEISREAE